MDVQALVVGAALLLVGFVIGRVTAPKEGHTIVYPPRQRDRAVIPGSDTDDPEIHALIQQGRKIEAIKRHRDLYKSDLREAKDAIDALASRLGR